MKKLAFIAFAMIAPIVFYSCGDAQDNKDSTEMAEDMNEEKFDDTHIDYDAEFAVKAASGGMMEVELGKLAQTNAQSTAVKEFGAGMVTDHSAANDELKAWANAKNVTLPAVPGEDHQEKIKKLSAKKGSDFDKAYMDFMVDDHKEDIKLFKNQVDKGGDADLKAWAQGKIPTLEHHLSMAEGIKEGIKKNK